MLKRTTIYIAVTVLCGFCAYAAAETVEMMTGAYEVKRLDDVTYESAADKTSDGLKMQRYAPERVKRPTPAIIMVRHAHEDDAACDWRERARWLTSHGYAVFLTRCRVKEGRKTAYRDVQAAVRYVRGNAEKLGVNPNSIGLWAEADGTKPAALVGLYEDHLPAMKDKVTPAEAPSARVQSVVLISKGKPVGWLMKRHVSFDDPPFLVLRPAGRKDPGRYRAPKVFRKENVEFHGYLLPGDNACKALDETVAVEDEDKPAWRIALDFNIEHLKMAPINIATELEKIIVNRVRAQNRVLGSQSIIDLRAVLQTAAHRLGHEPTPREMKVAREHAKELADTIVEQAAQVSNAPRVTRVIVMRAIASLSPEWPFTVSGSPAAAPR